MKEVGYILIVFLIFGLAFIVSILAACFHVVKGIVSLITYLFTIMLHPSYGSLKEKEE